MAFAVHINMEDCTGYNSVVARPVDALELHTFEPSSKDKIYKVRGRKSTVPDFKGELCTGCGVCDQACALDVIKLAGPWESRSAAKVQ